MVPSGMTGLSGHWRVGVCGWELSHNAAGRAATLVELYQRWPSADVRLIGCIFPRWGSELWGPIQGMSVRQDVMMVDDPARFLRQAEALVRRNPLDLLHLSKPRLPNMLIGLLYKQVWGTRVIVDVDDEELGFVGAEEPRTSPLSDDEGLEDLTGKLATQVSVGMIDCFDGVTVSNPALQSVYGGEVLPHARSEEAYTPSLSRRQLNRELFGIPLNKKVVLFSGTPRKHKGIMDIAQALSDLKRSDVLFVVVGDFPFPDVKEALKGIRGVNLKFIPGQPYWTAPDVVSVADVIVLLQDSHSLSARFQVPAKLVDALAMGVTVLAQPTPALEDLREAGAFVPVSREILTEKLGEALSYPVNPGYSAARLLFLERLSTGRVSARLADYVERLGCKRPGGLDGSGNLDLETLGETIFETDEAGHTRATRRFVDWLQQSADALR